MHQFQILGGAPALPLAALFDQVACIDALNYHRKLQILFCNKLTKLAKWQQLCLQLSHRPSLSNDRKGSNKDRKGLIGAKRFCFSTTLLAGLKQVFHQNQEQRTGGNVITKMFNIKICAFV